MRDICFLLIQDGEVRDCADRPCRLNWWAIKAFDAWRVAIGGINEFGEHEVAGIVAEVYPTSYDAPDIRISSELDGLDCLIANYPSITRAVFSRLDRLYCRSRLNDLANLPQPVIVRPNLQPLSASL
jgi:hypothetical protein